MKKKNIFIGLVVIAFAFTACEKLGDFDGKDIEGTYIGTLSLESSLKSVLDEGHGDSAITNITDMGDGMIEVHCYGAEFDTTLLLNYYDHNDSVMVCNTGAEFEYMYGHSLGQGHMGGGLMGDTSNGESNWMHHMSDEHDEGDEHFGGFNMENHSFEYTFESEHGSYHFQGSRE